MSLTLVRMRNAAVAVKIEATQGVDSIAGAPVTADFLAADLEVDFDPMVVENPELTGTLDKAPSIVGGLRPRLRLRIPLRGSGIAATAPEWGRLLRICTYAETVQAAAVGVPTAAASGTTTTVTAAAPFAATAQLYRGLPLAVSGDQAFTTGIIDYTIGRLISFGETRASALTISSLLQIPANVAYSPTSDESIYRTATVYFFADGFNWRFVGCVGTWSLELTTGGIGYLTFELRGQMLSMITAAVPVGWNTVIRPTPPRFVAGKSQLNLVTARARRIMLDAGVEVTLPDNPEAVEGYDPAVPISRDSKGTIDPLMDTATSIALYNNFRAGTAMPLIAIIGSTAGNRFLVTAPAAKATGFRPGTREGLGQHDIAFQLDGADSVLFLTAF